MIEDNYEKCVNFPSISIMSEDGHRISEFGSVNYLKW